MSNLKRVLACIMSVMFVACVGYYSLMSQTSAWFYDSGVIDSGDTFVFGDLSVDTHFDYTSPVIFDAATKFADENETLFDEVINVDNISVTNSGTVDARVYADVVNNGTSKGLQWFMYTDDMLVNGSVKETLKSVLPEMTAEALHDYNVGPDGNAGSYIVLEPGSSADVKIATWIEYDYVADQLDKGETLDGYDVDVTLYAVQNVDSAVKR